MPNKTNEMEKAAIAYVTSYFSDAYETKEPDGWFIRTLEFRNYLGKSQNPTSAWFNAERIVRDLVETNKLDEVRKTAYKNY